MKYTTPAALLLPLIAAATGCSQDQPTPAAQHYGVLIINGDVYDGSGGAARPAAIGIVGDRIETMDAAASATADRVIDAEGLAVMPGFIDPHTHALDDLKNPDSNTNLNYLAQGVTTVFVGNDGRGIPELDQTLALLSRQGMGTSLAFFSGHGTVRETVMGLENRPPTAEELRRMREIVDEEMRKGAIGLSTGLYYTPGSFAETDEVIELARVAAGYGGVYDSHLRDESSYSIGVLGAVLELIHIADQAGLPGHIAHLKALGRDVWGQSGDIIAAVDAARARGLDITADQYPYRASGTSFSSSLIPAWVRADSEEAMFARIENADLAEGIREEMEANLWRRGGADSLLVTGSDSRWRGMTLEEIAAELGEDAVDAAVQVVREGDPSIASFNMNPPDIQAFAIQKWVMTGSDGSEGHPREYASYPTVYQTMVVDEKWFPVEWFVRRSSALVADYARLCDRGYLEPGRKADIVMIDLDRYQPKADFEHPIELSTGVVHALVNGVAVIANADPTGALPGEVVDRQSLQCK